VSAQREFLAADSYTLKRKGDTVDNAASLTRPIHRRALLQIIRARRVPFQSLPAEADYGRCP